MCFSHQRSYQFDNFLCQDTNLCPLMFSHSYFCNYTFDCICPSLARQCAQLWLKTRESLGHPLGIAADIGPLIYPREALKSAVEKVSVQMLCEDSVSFLQAWLLLILVFFVSHVIQFCEHHFMTRKRDHMIVVSLIAFRNTICLYQWPPCNFSCLVLKSGISTVMDIVCTLWQICLPELSGRTIFILTCQTVLYDFSEWCTGVQWELHSMTLISYVFWQTKLYWKVQTDIQNY